MKAISSVHNEVVQHLIGLAKNSDYRKEYKSLLLEGKNAILELNKKMPLTRLIVTDQALIPPGVKANEILLVTDTIMNKITSVKTSEGIIAELPFPEMTPLHKKKRILALDRVSDPGNLGTLLRTTLALGWDGVFFLPGCADPFSDKAIRAAKGATFRLPLQQGGWSDLETLAQTNNLSIFISDLQGKKELAGSDKKLILVLGNEGEGVLPPKNFPHDKISIPMSDAMSSLNVAVAGGIMMYLLQSNSK